MRILYFGWHAKSLVCLTIEGEKCCVGYCELGLEWEVFLGDIPANELNIYKADDEGNT